MTWALFGRRNREPEQGTHPYRKIPRYRQRKVGFRLALQTPRRYSASMKHPAPFIFFLLIWSVLLPSSCTFQVDATDYVTACESGFTRCFSNRVEVCSNSGDLFLVAEDCGEDTCVNAQCVPAEESFTRSHRGNPYFGPEPQGTAVRGRLHNSPRAPTSIQDSGWSFLFK